MVEAAGIEPGHVDALGAHRGDIAQESAIYRGRR
jgi:hypothetical protein